MRALILTCVAALAACGRAAPSMQTPQAGGGGGDAAPGGGIATAGGATAGGAAGGSAGGVIPTAGGSTAGGVASAGGAAGGALTATQCFANEYVNPISSTGPNYDQYSPTLGSHCRGTNHQNISGIERVVFLGDSVTVGTPPTNLNVNDVYRAILAKKLATRFGLTPPGFGWGGANPLDGQALPRESGDFVSCSKWGARVDDLMRDNHQVEDCIPPNKRHLKHLVVMTMGGNDIASITKAGGGAMPEKTVAELQVQAQQMIDDLRAAVAWMKNPANVPGGVDVVFANNYEFTDGTGETASCPGASLAGIEPWTDVQAQTRLVVWIEEQYLKIAKDTGSDMVFMLESFCGHGYKRNDPAALCYRGPNQPLWFDGTCIHPNAAGHAALAELFFQTIAE